MDEMVATRARAPVRIDFAGGWTDVSPFCLDHGGLVVNATISRYAHVTLKPRHDLAYEISSGDSGASTTVMNIRDLEYNGTLDLLKAAVRRWPELVPEGGVTLTIRSDAPPGSGVGSSSAAAVAALATLVCSAGHELCRESVARDAFRLETEELKILGGKQDQYAASIGGMLALRFEGGEVMHSNLQVPHDRKLELEERLILCYTGRSRLSGDNVSRVVASYREGSREVTRALHSLLSIAGETVSALEGGDLDGLGRLMSANWSQQKRLDDGVSTPEIETAMSIAAECGAAGAKACGAGGGGCVLILARDGSDGPLRRGLTGTGFTVLNFSFTEVGVEVWHP